MEIIKKWRFASANYVSDDGLNDAGIETFSTSSESSNIREVIQNALDSISLEAVQAEKPVIVEFDDFYIKSDDFPGKNQFLQILEKCIESSKNNSQVVDYFEQAIKYFDKNLKILRISDFNTTGLVGAENDARDKAWHSLIKSRGHSNKNMDSGGSFGIGKSAPFTCSGLRTVFYSSKVDDIYSYIGVARLVSHVNEEGQLTVGTGYYSETEKLGAILEQFKIADYSREENGTDIFIIGYDGNNDMRQLIIETTLKNFFITIYKKKLIVKYKDIEINSENLGHYIAELDDNTYFDLKTYYEMLVTIPEDDDEDDKRIFLDASEYGEKYNIKDKEAILLLKRADNLNRSILMTRKSGMTLFEQKNISGSISFTGILMIEGERMNELFKNMEVPAHNAWEPKRCKVNPKLYENVYKDLRDYLRKKVTQYFSKASDESISVYGMEEFFSDVTIESGKKKASILSGDVHLETKKKKVNQRRKNIIIAGSGNSSEKENEYLVRTKLPNRIKPKDKDETDKKVEEIIKRKYKYMPMKMWLKCRNEQNGEYSIKFKLAKNKKYIKLEFLGVAEKGKYKLEISEVSIDSNNAEVEIIQNNELYLKEVNSNINISIDFKIDFDKKCMMGVNYYETK